MLLPSISQTWPNIFWGKFPHYFPLEIIQKNQKQNEYFVLL